MFQGMYNRRLREDLPRWIDKGWVPLDGARAIAVETEPESLASRLPALIGLLGTLVLLATGGVYLLSMWDEMPRLTRLIILLGTMLAGLIFGFIVSRSNYYYVEEVSQLLSAAIFGLALYLVADMYFIDSHLPDLLLAWAGGCFVIAFLLSGKAPLCLGIIVMTAWTVLETTEFDQLPHLWYLPVLALAVGIAIWTQARAGLHLAVVSFTVWVAVTIGAFATSVGWPQVSIPVMFVQIALLALALAYILRDRTFTFLTEGFQVPLERYALFGLFATLFALQLTGRSYAEGLATADEIDRNYTWMVIAIGLFIVSTLSALVQYRDARLKPIDIFAQIAAGGGALLFAFALTSVPEDTQYLALAMSWGVVIAYLALCLWLIAFGRRRRDPFLINLGLFAFAAEVLFYYWRLYYGQLDQTTFLLIGGAILIGLAVVLSLIREALLEPTPDQALTASAKATTTAGTTTPGEARTSSTVPNRPKQDLV